MESEVSPIGVRKLIANWLACIQAPVQEIPWQVSGHFAHFRCRLWDFSLLSCLAGRCWWFTLRSIESEVSSNRRIHVPLSMFSAIHTCPLFTMMNNSVPGQYFLAQACLSYCWCQNKCSTREGSHPYLMHLPSYYCLTVASLPGAECRKYAIT